MNEPAFGDPRLPKRFWNKVEPEESGCWLWAGGLDIYGYGRFRYGKPMQLAHRVSYSELAAAIPVGLEIDHLCRVRRCVNPAHLEPVTGRVNLQRGAAAVTHCPEGHAYTPDNTYQPPSRAARMCRTCRTQRAQRLRASRVSRPRVSPTHCPSGHEYTPENSLFVGKETRRCRTCRREQMRRSEAKQRARAMLGTPSR